MPQIDRTLQRAVTSRSPGEVLTAAKQFFVRRNAVYTAFIDMEGPDFVTLRGQGGEEIVVAAVTQDGVTHVTGSTYLFDQQVARFLSTLPAPAVGAIAIPATAESLA